MIEHNIIIVRHFTFLYLFGSSRSPCLLLKSAKHQCARCIVSRRCARSKWFDKSSRREIVLPPISDPASSKIARRLTFLSPLSPPSPPPPSSIDFFIVSRQTYAHYFVQVCSAFRSIALHRLSDGRSRITVVFISTPRKFSLLFRSTARTANNIHLHIYAPCDVQPTRQQNASNFERQKSHSRNEV